MIRILFFLMLLVSSCVPTQSGISRNTSNNSLTNKKGDLRNDPPSIDYDKNLKVAMICYVHQFSGDDSSNKSVSQTIEYYPNGKIASRTYKGYKESAIKGPVDRITRFDYQDSLLVQERSEYTHFYSYSTQRIMIYNQKNQCIKVVSYNNKKRLKPSARRNKGIGRPGGCIIREKDYEKKPSWAIRSIISYHYDPLGKKVEYYASDIHWGSQNRYTWAYNENGQIKEYCSYDHDRLIWKKAYRYTDSTYQYTMTWYDYDGNPKQFSKNSWDHYPQIRHTFRLDEKGREIEEQVATEDGEFRSRTVTEYNADGLVAKTVRYDESQKPEMTHIYEYEKIEN
ncbi:MAG: hypothetical protein AAF587_05970 [Bacteroidota bacterium]